MDKKYNQNLIPRAKELRKNMTKEERHLWYDYLRSLPQKFVRQKVLGNYIADFYCASDKLVIELDGSQHYDNTGMQYDERRTEYMKQFGIRVVRIPNNEIWNHFSDVCSYIDSILNTDSTKNEIKNNIQQEGPL